MRKKGWLQTIHPGSGTTPTHQGLETGYSGSHTGTSCSGQRKSCVCSSATSSRPVYKVQSVRGVECQGGCPVAQPTDPHTALAPSLIGSARPDPPPAHLKSDTAKEFQPLLPRPPKQRGFSGGRGSLPQLPNPPKTQRAPLGLHCSPSKGEFRIFPALLFGPPLPSCVPQEHSMPQPSPLPQASLHTPQSSGLSKLSVKKRVGSAISLRSINSAIFSPRPPNLETIPKARLSPSSTNQLTLLKKGESQELYGPVRGLGAEHMNQ